VIELIPITLREANAFVEAHHRHHGPSRGCIAAVAVAGRVCGVAIIGRPVARGLQDGWTAEVTRCCTDGTRNAASMLYGAAWRATRALGYKRLVTYTLSGRVWRESARCRAQDSWQGYGAILVQKEPA
jgi:hypothetical protein